MSQKSKIEFYGKQYNGSFSWLSSTAMVLTISYKTEDLEDLLDLDDHQEIIIKVDGLDKKVVVLEPTLIKDENGNHAMIECKVVE